MRRPAAPAEPEFSFPRAGRSLRFSRTSIQEVAV